MNEEEAKVVIYLANCEKMLRNTYAVANKLGKSYTTAFNMLKIMEAGGKVKAVLSGKKTFWEVADGSVYEQAKSVLGMEVQ